MGKVFCVNRETLALFVDDGHPGSAEAPGDKSLIHLIMT